MGAALRRPCIRKAEFVRALMAEGRGEVRGLYSGKSSPVQLPPGERVKCGRIGPRPCCRVKTEPPGLTGLPVPSSHACNCELDQIQVEPRLSNRGGGRAER